MGESRSEGDDTSGAESTFLAQALPDTSTGLLDYGLDDTDLGLGTDDTQQSDSSLDDFQELLEVPRENYVRGIEMARGGMGRIIRARDRRLGRALVIKELLTRHPDQWKRFEREMRITAKLQHPNIVSIHESGRWRSGEPFFAMEWIKGRSLEDVIKSTKSYEDRVLLLSNVLAVADAMSYAHDSHVIHRDLKPANVLIGDFGETVVIDWGLAKHLHEDDVSDAPIAGSQATVEIDAPLTVFGRAMGTPAYMPPEQARGEIVDERADVYSLGAILHHVLSGKRPYFDTKNSQPTLTPVLEGPPVPLSALEQRVPPDLLAIVDKAMSRNASERYASAREFAEDLRRFMEGQRVSVHSYSSSMLFRRWLRRHRAAVSVAGVMVLALAVLGAISVLRISQARDKAAEQRDRAEANRQLAAAQRDKAEENQDEIEEMLDFMLVEMREKLRPIGRVDLLEATATQAGDYYKRTPIQWDVKADILRRTEALYNLADVLLIQGKTAEGLEQLREALELMKSSPLAEEIRPQIARFHSKIGGELYPLGDFEAARSALQTSLEIRKAIVDGLGENRSATAVQDLANSTSRLGTILLMGGRQEEARSYLLEAVELTQWLVDDAPDDLRLRSKLAKSEYLLGELELSQSNAKDALPRFEKAIDIYAVVADKTPDDIEWERELSTFYNKLGEAQQALGELDASMESGRYALELAKQLVKRAPDNTTFQRDLTVSYEKVADLLKVQGKYEDALELYREGLAIRKNLADSDASNYRWKRDVAVGITSIASVYEAQGKTREALDNYRESLALREVLTEKDPENQVWQQGVALQNYFIGNLLDGKRKTQAEARQHFLACAKRWDLNPSRAYYSAACYARAGENDLAFQHLNKALDDGSLSIEELKGDEEFESLRRDRRWKELMQRTRPASE